TVPATSHVFPTPAQTLSQLPPPWNQQNPPTSCPPGEQGSVVLVVDEVVVVVVAAFWQVFWPGPVRVQKPEQHSELEEHGVPIAPQASVVLVVVVVGVVVVVLAGFVVVVVVDGAAWAGAQRSWAALGVKVWVPNWSVTVTTGGVPLGHFTL